MTSTAQTAAIVGASACVVAIVVWSFYLRWLLRRVAKPTYGIFLINVVAVLCLGPGMMLLLPYILSSLRVTVAAERDIVFFTYLAVAALLALFTIVRVSKRKSERSA